MLLLNIVWTPFGATLVVTTLFKEPNLESLLKFDGSFEELVNKINEAFFTEVLRFFKVIGVENVAESWCLHFDKACEAAELLYESLLAELTEVECNRLYIRKLCCRTTNNNAAFKANIIKIGITITCNCLI